MVTDLNDFVVIVKDFTQSMILVSKFVFLELQQTFKCNRCHFCSKQRRQHAHYSHSLLLAGKNVLLKCYVYVYHNLFFFVYSICLSFARVYQHLHGGRDKQQYKSTGKVCTLCGCLIKMEHNIYIIFFLS